MLHIVHTWLHSVKGCWRATHSQPRFTLIVFCNYRSDFKVKLGWSTFYLYLSMLLLICLFVWFTVVSDQRFYQYLRFSFRTNDLKTNLDLYAFLLRIFIDCLFILQTFKKLLYFVNLLLFTFILFLQFILDIFILGKWNL